MKIEDVISFAVVGKPEVPEPVVWPRKGHEVPPHSSVAKWI